MNLITPIQIDRSPWSLTYEHRILMLGSCFSDNIARKMQERYLRVTANPFGTLYNPISIAHHITDELLADKDVIIITFGTAWVYIDKLIVDSLELREPCLAAVVDNCQKRPATDFIRYRLTIEDIVQTWQPILERYSDKRFIFTVSPIRHKKDGLHENQISKGILLQAIDILTSNSISGPTSNSVSALTSYFPSYEILLDELRDYRFYADDLVHPSMMAVEYIWERFMDTYLYDEATRQSMNELHRYWQNTQHRLLHPDTEESRKFIASLAQQKIELQERYPLLKDLF